MKTQNLEEIKKIVSEFFQKMGFEVKIEIGLPKDLTLPINLTSDDSQLLIGEGGQTLLEIQHLLKAILKRRRQSFNVTSLFGEKEVFYIDLDINDYKKKKIKYLKDLAKSLADEVALTKKEKVLPPMPAYERRIIHLELAGRGDVTTQSTGKEPERKVIIRPYP